MTTRATGIPLVSPQSNPGKTNRRGRQPSKTVNPSSSKIDTLNLNVEAESSTPPENKPQTPPKTSPKNSPNSTPNSTPPSTPPTTPRNMAEDMVHPFDRTIGESTRVIAPNRGSASRPPTTAPNFNVKGNHLSRVEENQFDGVVKWDPYDHVEKFEKVCRLFKYGETQMPLVKLELFPLSLTGEATNWY
uniref:circumsporozoite protein-like n=1 Tax=Erigeron canadensis TaxID=72917 RepID=UPI001CB9AE51|nr:circumsporozoite protein-like [Erigeron canadensis]